MERLNGYWARVQYWVGGHFYVVFFLYIKSSSSLLFVVFLMEEGVKEITKKKELQPWEWGWQRDNYQCCWEANFCFLFLVFGFLCNDKKRNYTSHLNPPDITENLSTLLFPAVSESKFHFHSSPHLIFLISQISISLLLPISCYNLF